MNRKTSGLLALPCLLIALCLSAQNTQPTLKLGDKAPALKPFKWIQGEPVTTFQKDHWYIVEFGATWCAPCAEAIPKLAQLADDLGDTATVISLFVMESIRDKNGQQPAYVARVEAYVKKRNPLMDYTVAVDDPQGTLNQTWLKAAGRNGIPYTFLVDGEGTIAWMGVDLEKMKAVIKEKMHTPQTPAKEQAPTANMPQPSVPQTRFEKMMALADSTGTDAFFASFLTTYTPGENQRINAESPYYVDNYRWTTPDSPLATRRDRILAVCTPLRRLYYMAYSDTLWNYPPSHNPSTGEYPDTIRWPNQKRAYGKYANFLILEVADSTPFEMDRIRFDYLLKMPTGMGTSANMQQRMQDDLKAAFGYEATLETRMLPYWKLTATAKGQRQLPVKKQDHRYKMYEDEEGNVQFENADMRDIIFQLEIRFGYGGFGYLQPKQELQPPFVDETGIKTKINYQFPCEFRLDMERYKEEGRKYPFEAYREMLRTQGLELTKGYKPMKVVVVRDKVDQSKHP